jgi:hypothetical protein
LYDIAAGRQSRWIAAPPPAQSKEDEMNTLKRVNKCFTANRACLVLALIMSFGVWNSAMAQSFPETVPLPDGFQPEGIALGIGHTAYVGSLAGGAIYAVDLRTGTGSTLVPGLPGTLFAVGLDFDARRTAVCTIRTQAKCSINSP